MISTLSRENQTVKVSCHFSNCLYRYFPENEVEGHFVDIEEGVEGVGGGGGGSSTDNKIISQEQTNIEFELQVLQFQNKIIIPCSKYDSNQNNQSKHTKTSHKHSFPFSCLQITNPTLQHQLLQMHNYNIPNINNSIYTNARLHITKYHYSKISFLTTTTCSISFYQDTFYSYYLLPITYFTFTCFPVSCSLFPNSKFPNPNPNSLLI